MVGLVALAPLAGQAALRIAGASIVRSATRGIVDGTAYWAGAELVAQIAEWARSIDGNWDSAGETPGDGVSPENGCWKMDSGAAIFEENSRQNPDVLDPPTAGKCDTVSATATIIERLPDTDTLMVQLTSQLVDGSTWSGVVQRFTGWKWRLNPACGGGVCSSDPYPNPGGEPLAPINTGPIQSGDCTINTTFHGFLANPNGTGGVQPVFVMEPAVESRASGGVIVGECNFQPTVVVGGGGDGGEPPKPIPNPPYPPGGDDWWKAIAQGVTAGLTEEILENILNRPYPEVIYRHVSVCEKDEDGEPISEAVEIPINALKAPDAQIARLDAIVELLQAHKNFKQPICPNEKPELLGDWVTTRWESDEKMVDSGRRLRKLFRYRTQSSRDLGQLSAYWCGFSWKSGPVCVRHQGAWWGDPQVWAESAEEGKRVIRHAAAEAGLDPDQAGRWAVSSSRSPRYGMSGTMKILKKEGFPWIASRDGANWPNYLAQQRDP